MIRKTNPIIDEMQYFERTGRLFPPGVTCEADLPRTGPKKILKVAIGMIAAAVLTSAAVVVLVAGVGALE
jgi:hypothetical protein